MDSIYIFGFLLLAGFVSIILYQNYKEKKIDIKKALKFLISGVILAEVIYAFGVLVIYFFGLEVSGWYVLLGQIAIICVPLFLYSKKSKK